MRSFEEHAICSKVVAPGFNLDDKLYDVTIEDLVWSEEGSCRIEWPYR